MNRASNVYAIERLSKKLESQIILCWVRQKFRRLVYMDCSVTLLRLDSTFWTVGSSFTNSEYRRSLLVPSSVDMAEMDIEPDTSSRSERTAKTSMKIDSLWVSMPEAALSGG